MQSEGKILKVRCPDCKKEFYIMEKDICTNVRGEKFIACNQPYSFPTSRRHKFCTGYISIPEDVIQDNDNDNIIAK